eukprot:1175811-Amorphochlora_amoeboformis.AAC.1
MRQVFGATGSVFTHHSVVIWPHIALQRGASATKRTFRSFRPKSLTTDSTHVSEPKYPGFRGNGRHGMAHAGRSGPHPSLPYNYSNQKAFQIFASVKFRVQRGFGDVERICTKELEA